MTDICISYLSILVGIYVDDSTIMEKPELLTTVLRLFLLFCKLAGFKVSESKVQFHWGGDVRKDDGEDPAELAEMLSFADAEVCELLVSLGLGYERGPDFIELQVTDYKVLKAHRLIDTCREGVRMGRASSKMFQRLFGFL